MTAAREKPTAMRPPADGRGASSLRISDLTDAW
ncbi:hypothetical protein BKA21_002154 [Cellulomonas oligotrophica]|uniref:Uncharacterized protein n=1 Tax=Cellulomonas oligotrophica TaxID=931536 RepID=A0A7Y9FFZ5_9CELL|nr:hypothetical protein [Cellulomonas oligotrophica]